MSDSFLYFAFGSNLLTERIHLNNKSARKVSVGKLENFKLIFSHYSKRWKGAVASIIEESGSVVYGILWQIDLSDLRNLDNQESVHIGIYYPIEVTVESENGEIYKARTYKLKKLDENYEVAQPSYIYLDVILKGATENGLPEEYIKQLQKIKHNGYKGPVNLELSLSEGS